MNINKLLELEEGFSPTPYYCTEGYPTIGIGTKIGTKGAPLEQYLLTVNLRVAYVLMEDKLEVLEEALKGKLEGIDPARSAVLLSMAYQLGINGLLKFKNMWKAIESGDWEEAAKQALDSKWARQTPERAKRHAEVLRIGSLDKVYKMP